MRRFFAGIPAVAIAIIVLTGCASTRAVQSHSSPLPSFSVVVTTIPNGWAARCDSGCQWRAASFKCATECDANVDANGFVTIWAPRTQPSAFSFRLAHSGNGFRATSQIGTAWRTLNWGCRVESCSARVDAHGVSPDALPR